MESTLSQNAVQSDTESIVKLYPVNKIFADPSFNCRGEILPLDVIDLAKSIADVGLQQPIIIRPRLLTTPTKFEYIVVSGHRRHKAYQVNGAVEIPAILRLTLTEFQARKLNAEENLKRQSLNIIQEARCVKPFLDAGWNRQDVARELGMSDGWVQIRVMLLQLEPELQEGAAAGVFNTTDIRTLHSIKSTTKRFEAAKMIKEHREKQQSKRDVVVVKVPTRASQKKMRKKYEIQEIINILLDTVGPCITTRCLAWASANITDYELHSDLKEYFADQGKEYKIPEFDKA